MIEHRSGGPRREATPHLVRGAANERTAVVTLLQRPVGAQPEVVRYDGRMKAGQVWIPFQASPMWRDRLMERKANLSSSHRPAERDEAPLAAAVLRHALFPVAATREADRLAVESGISISRLMASAGARVAETVLDRWPACPVVVLCGPGDNGGDGYVVALRLRMAGRPVSVRALGSPHSTAARAAEARWKAAGGATKSLADWDAGAALSESNPPLLVDALFGAGLSRPLAGPAAKAARQAGTAGAAVLSVDVPSGLDGDSGA